MRDDWQQRILAKLGNRKLGVLSFEALAGSPYSHLKNKVDILGFPDAEGSQDPVDPVVGLRLMAGLTEKLWLRGEAKPEALTLETHLTLPGM